MITPAEYDQLQMFSGDAFDLQMNWRDASNNIFNLTGYHAKMTFYQSFPDNGLVIQLTDPVVAGLGITLSNGSSPNIRAQIPNTQTVFSPWPNYYVLELTDPTNSQFRLMVGRLLYVFR